MSVIAFRPRKARADLESRGDGSYLLSGTFRSPRGRAGRLTGHLRVQRLLLAPRGVFVTGFFTAELREPDGDLVGVDSLRATVAADLVPDQAGLRPLVRPVQLDFMGITVRLDAFPIGPALRFPRAGERGELRRTPRTRGSR